MRINLNQLESFSNEELLTFYCNAANTGCRAGGHTKAHMNELQAKKLAAELTNRSVTVPDYYEAASQGTFNGAGSW